MSVSQPPNLRNSLPVPPADPAAEYWVHWHYSEAEWQAWIAADLERARTHWIGWRIVPGLIGVVLLAIFLSWGASEGALPSYMITATLMSVIVCIAWFSLGLRAYSTAHEAFAQRYRGPREVAISPWWVWHSGQFTPLLRSMQNRLQVQLIGGRPMWLRFDIEELDWNIQATRRRSITVPVPEGREPDARQLVARFKREIIGGPPAPRPPGRPAAPVSPPALSGRGTNTAPLPPLPPAASEAETQALRDDGSPPPVLW